MKPEPSRRLVGDLKLIENLSDEQQQRLLTALQSIETQLRPFETISTVLSECLGSEGDSERLPNIIIGLFYYYVSTSLSPVDAAQTISDRVARSPEADHDANRRLKQFLERLFSLERLFLSIKATTLFEDQERVLLSMRILTDVRPIFQNDRVGDAVGTVLTHKLKLVFQESSADTKELYFALSDEELDELANSVERAREKNSVLLSLLAKLELPVVRLSASNEKDGEK